MPSLSPQPLSEPHTIDAIALGPARAGGPDSRDLLPGAWLAGRYEILARIGRGGAGWVYSARDHREGGRVALKVLSRREGGTIARRAAHEIGMTSAIDHPNVVRALDLEHVDGRSVLVMELVDGEPVARLLRRAGPLPVGRAIAIARDVALGLEGAHARGVVHRDLKPGNVILDRDGRARIADFGLAIAAAGEDRGRQAVVGTPEYMAPEQVEGRACDRRADVYALGVMLYEMLTGALPFRGSGPIDTALERLRRDPIDPCTSNAALPRWLGDLVLRCLAREPAERVGSMSDVLRWLEQGERHEAEHPTLPLAALEGATRRRRLTRVLVMCALAALLVAAGALSAPALFDRAGPVPSVWADGTVRVTVAESASSATGEPVSRVVGAGVVEALRARLGTLDGVVVIDAPASGTPAVAVEQVWSLNVLPLGGELRVVATVTSLPGSERWLTIEESSPWEGSWERVDAIADAMIERYARRLAEER